MLGYLSNDMPFEGHGGIRWNPISCWKLCPRHGLALWLVLSPVLQTQKSSDPVRRWRWLLSPNSLLELTIEVNLEHSASLEFQAKRDLFHLSLQYFPLLATVLPNRIMAHKNRLFAAMENGQIYLAMC